MTSFVTRIPDKGDDKFKVLNEAMDKLQEARPDLVVERPPHSHVLDMYDALDAPFDETDELEPVPKTRPEGFSKLAAVSGGAGGADEALLVTSRKLGIETMGYVPDGYLQKPGNAERLEGYRLQELPGGKYPDKDKKNVELSDLVVAILQWDTSTGKHTAMTGKGAMQTVNYATKGVYEFTPQVIERCSVDDATFGWVKTIKGDLGHRDALIIFVVDGNLEAFKRDKGHIEAIANALIEFEKKGQPKTHLMISGPTEETLPGIKQAASRVLESALMAYLRIEEQ